MDFYVLPICNIKEIFSYAYNHMKHPCCKSLPFGNRIFDTQGNDYANQRLEVRGLRLEVRGWKIEVGKRKSNI